MTVTSVLLITSNGFGMGHLVRQLAIKSAMPAGVRCTILTLSGAAPIAIEAGAVMEYCPSYTRFEKRAWHRGYLADRIEALATEVNADLLLFDGVVPYVGLLDALTRLDVTAVWMRRGVWRPSAQKWPLKYSSFFDLIIEPGDVGRLLDVGPTAQREDAHRVGVITQAGAHAMVPREDAAARLGIDPQRPTLLLNIGSNRIAGLDEMEASLLARFPEWNIITTRDALGRNRSDSSGVSVVSGIFPLHPYLSAVDLAVTSVGYNAAHEFLACGVPVVAVPADNATDDQYARADAMAEVGAAVVVRAETGDDLLQALTPLLLDAELRQQMRTSALAFATDWGDGAKEAVAAILGARSNAQITLAAGLRLRVRLWTERLLGLVSSLQFWRIPTQTIRLTEEISMADVTGPDRIEHLLPGLGEAYRARRAAIANRW